MKFDFTIHSKQPYITQHLGLNNLKIGNINVKVVDQLVVLTIDGSATISNHNHSFVSSNTLTIHPITKFQLPESLPAQKIMENNNIFQTSTTASNLTGFFPFRFNTITNWLSSILITEISKS